MRRIHDRAVQAAELHRCPCVWIDAHPRPGPGAAPAVPTDNNYLQRMGRRYRTLSTSNKLALWSAAIAALAFAVPIAVSAWQTLFPSIRPRCWSNLTTKPA